MNPEDVAEAIAAACEAASEAASSSGFSNGVMVGVAVAGAVILGGVMLSRVTAPQQAALPQSQAHTASPYVLASYL